MAHSGARDSPNRQGAEHAGRDPQPCGRAGVAGLVLRRATSPVIARSRVATVESAAVATPPRSESIACVATVDPAHVGVERLAAPS